MKRRNFLKTVLAAIGIAAVAPVVTKTSLKRTTLYFPRYLLVMEQQQKSHMGSKLIGDWAREAGLPEGMPVNDVIFVDEHCLPYIT